MGATTKAGRTRSRRGLQKAQLSVATASQLFCGNFANPSTTTLTFELWNPLGGGEMNPVFEPDAIVQCFSYNANEIVNAVFTFNTGTGVATLTFPAPFSLSDVIAVLPNQQTVRGQNGETIATYIFLAPS